MLALKENDPARRSPIDTNMAKDKGASPERKAKHWQQRLSGSEIQGKKTVLLHPGAGRGESDEDLREFPKRLGKRWNDARVLHLARDWGL